MLEALRLGYRLLDTAQAYENEAELGRALARAALPRAEVFIATKRLDVGTGHGSGNVREADLTC